MAWGSVQPHELLTENVTVKEKASSSYLESKYNSRLRLNAEVKEEEEEREEKRTIRAILMVY